MTNDYAKGRADAFVICKPVTVEDCPDAHAVQFCVGNRSFAIGEAMETKEEAEWYADQFKAALSEALAQQPSEGNPLSYETALKDAKARQLGENIDGSKRRETVPERGCWTCGRYCYINGCSEFHYCPGHGHPFWQPKEGAKGV